MQYIDIVNSVLVRLRESKVTSVNDTAYSSMIATFVNDAKKQVENAYNWNCLTESLTVNTTAGTFSYVLNGASQRFRLLDALNITDTMVMRNVSTEYMDRLFLTTNTQPGSPHYFNFNGASNGDSIVDIYPPPDKVYTLRFNCIVPQADLVADSDVLVVPADPVVFLAYAKTIAERGEDGGLTSSEAYALYQTSLADNIAIESNRYVEDSNWTAV